MSTPTKAKRNTWYTAEDKDFLLLGKEWAVADLLEDSTIFVKKVFTIFALRQIAARRPKFETRAMLDCRCYGQHSHENESRTEIRREIYTNCFRLR